MRIYCTIDDAREDGSVPRPCQAEFSRDEDSLNPTQIAMVVYTHPKDGSEREPLAKVVMRRSELNDLARLFGV